MDNFPTIATIRNLCEINNVSASKMLSDCGLWQSLLADCERKNKLPTAENLSKIASYFSVSVDFLLGLDNIPNRKLSEDSGQEKA